MFGFRLFLSSSLRKSSVSLCNSTSLLEKKKRRKVNYFKLFFRRTVYRDEKESNTVILPSTQIRDRSAIQARSPLEVQLRT